VLRGLVAGVAAALVLPASAQAALSFAFERTQARPGQRVHAYQADADGNPAPAWDDVPGVTLYLVRVNDVNGRRVRLGPMRVDDVGVWSIIFRIPKMRPGLYTIAFFCRPCGNTFFPSTLPGTPWSAKPGGRVLKVRR
jgi:hypothetical protein